MSASRTRNKVSIHSPRRSEGRRSRMGRSCVLVTGFNPLSPPKRGETRRRPAYPAGAHVSIHSPRRSEGRPLPALRLARPGQVSIHSPRRSEGRQALTRSRGRPRVFQSTLPAEARGDLATEESAEDGGSLFQSTLPAEARGDRRSSPAGLLARRGFNPLSPPKRGETWTTRAWSSLLLCFNPLSPPKRGETGRLTWK